MIRGSSEERAGTVPSNHWRFATIHGVCSFPWLPGHVWTARKTHKIIETKLLLLIFSLLSLKHIKPLYKEDAGDRLRNQMVAQRGQL